MLCVLIRLVVLVSNTVRSINGVVCVAVRELSANSHKKSAVSCQSSVRDAA